MLARTLEGRIVLMRRTGLRDVRNLVPHDRVDHLEPLSRDGLQRFAVRHAAVAAPRVVLAPPPVGSGEAVAREDKQVLQALVALPGRRHRRHRSPGLAVARRQPAVRRQPVMVREVVDVYGDRQLGRRFRPYPGDGEQASVGLVALEQGGYLRRGGLELGRVFGDPPRQEPHRAVLGGDRGRVRPGRRPHGPDERVHLAAPRAAGEGRRPSAPGVGHRPRPAEGGHEPQFGDVGQVDQRLELGARLQQDAAQPVFAPGALAGQEVPLRRERPRRGDRGVGMGDRQQRVRDAERGLRDDHRVALVGLGVAAEQPGGLVGGQARQVRRRHSRRPRAGERERADVADLVDDDEGSGELGEKQVEGVFPVGYGLAREHLAVARRDARPVRRLPDVEPYDDFRPSRWCHGGILQSSGRSEALPATPTLPGRGARARQFPISRSERRAPSVATPPGPSSGQGQTAIRRRPIGGPSGLARIVGNAPNARHRSSSMAYLGL